MAASEAFPIAPLENEKVKQLMKSNESEFDCVKEPARTILEQYSKIPPGQILGHVKRVVCTANHILKRHCLNNEYRGIMLMLSLVSSNLSHKPRYIVLTKPVPLSLHRTLYVSGPENFFFTKVP